MPENDVPNPLMNLPRRPRKTPRLDARNRFILLLALFNAMICVLVLLSLQNVRLKEENRNKDSYIRALTTRQDSLEVQLTDLEQVVESVVAKDSTQIAELKASLQSPAVVPPTAYPTYTPYPTYTFEPIDTPVPPTPLSLPPTRTSTIVPPSPTNTPVPPTPTWPPPTPTATPLPPTPTATPLPPSPTDTPVPPTPTPEDTNTPTPVPPTPTPHAPVVLGISPNNGETGSSVSVVDLRGQFFESGATARIYNDVTSISLVPSIVVSPTMITGTLDLSVAAGGSWDVIVTNPDSQSGIATNTFTVTIPFSYSYGMTATCSISVTNCLDIIGPPDSDFTEIQEGGVITLDLGIGNGIMNGRGYDMVFYEYDNLGVIYLDWTIIELSEDLSSWQTVFNWGDGYQSPPTCTDSPSVACDDFTNVLSFSNDADGEQDNEVITTTLLYNGPGILIDIDFLGGLPTALYRFVRLSSPDNGPASDPAQADSIERLH
jgi:hypothetical protein